MHRNTIVTALIALLVVAGSAAPAVALAAPDRAGDADAAVLAAQSTPENDSNVTVEVGQQLATVITVSSDDVQTEFEDTAFELEVERGDDEARAEAVADRADELRERAEAIREDYEAATEAFEAGELTRSQYAQRLAELNARATNLLRSYEQLSVRAEAVSALELRAAGANLTSLDAALEDVSSVTGAGSSAMLAQFLGEADGEIELETADGIRIEVEREDGETSREFERPRDADMNITVPQDEALQTARDALSTPDEGRWVLVEAKVKPLEGAYEFEFELADAPGREGESEVRVDGSTGEIYRLEQETESRDDGDDEEREELTIVVVEGTPAPGATVTLKVLADGEPVEGVTVYLNDEPAGTTDANGTDQFALPDSGDVEFSVEHGDAEGELEFEFGHEHESDEVFRQLNVDATRHDGSVVVEVRFDGQPVENATVYVNDERVGKTGADGTVSFAFDPATEEDLELEVVKGAFEAELTYAHQDGTLVLVEAEHEGDGDKAERDDEHEADDDDADEHDADEHEADDEADEHEADDDEADEHDDAEPALAMAVVDGTVEAGGTVTIEVTADGEPVEGATVTLNGDVVGQTDAHGRLVVTLPADDDADLRVEHGDAETRLELEYEVHDDVETEATG